VLAILYDEYQYGTTLPQENSDRLQRLLATWTVNIGNMYDTI
jgi:hypothetical protein